MEGFNNLDHVEKYFEKHILVLKNLISVYVAAVYPYVPVQ